MTQLMGLKLAKVIGHRGASTYAPENTIESICTAGDMGVEWIELDVKLTRDDVPIIFHDEELDRTTNGAGKVAEMLYSDIQALEAGSWFGDSFTGIQVPTLEEAVEAILQYDMGLNLEIKPCPGREKQTAEAALDILSQIWDAHDKILISSFQHVSLEAARDVAYDWPRGLLIGPEQSPDGGLPDNWKEMAEYLEVQTINLGSHIASREDVEEIIDEDYFPIIYTVNDPQEARRYQQWGVEAMVSDCPDVILENIFTVH